MQSLWGRSTVLRLALLATVLTVSGCSLFYSKLPPQPPNPFVKDPTYQKLSPFQQDFRYYLHILRQSHPNPYAILPRHSFDSLAAALDAQLATETDTTRFRSELAQFAAALGDGHTGIRYQRKPGPEYPIRVRWFEEGWHITAIDSSYSEEMIGARLTMIGDHPADEVMNGLMKLSSGENAYFLRFMAAISLRFPANLAQLGVASSDGNLHLGLNIAGRDSAVTMRPVDAYLLRAVPAHPVTGKRNPYFSGKPIPEHNLYYLQFNQFTDRHSDPDMKDAPIWSDFLDSVFTRIDSLGLRYLVVDLRYNGGGNSSLGDQLLYHCTGRDSVYAYSIQNCFSELLKDNYQWRGLERYIAHEHKLTRKDVKLPYCEPPIDPDHLRRFSWQDYTAGIVSDCPWMKPVAKPYDGRLILMVGSNTFSSAVDLATTCQDNGLAVLYGSPTGGKPSCFGDILTFTLPNSKIPATVSYKYFCRPDPRRDPQDSLYPDVQVLPTPVEYFDSRDIVWERVLHDIDSGTVPPAHQVP
jgi:hypothetical protein